MLLAATYRLCPQRRGFISPGSLILLGALAILAVAFVLGAHIVAQQESKELLPKLQAALPPESADWQMLKSADPQTASARYIMKSDMTKYVTVTYRVELDDLKPVYDIVQKIPPSTPADTKINQANLVEYVKNSRALYGDQGGDEAYLVIFAGSIPVMLQAKGLPKDMVMDFADKQVPVEQLVALDRARLVPPFLR